MSLRAGLTLLEVLVALAILGIGAAAWGGFAAQGMHGLHLATARDVEMQHAAAELGRLSIQPAAVLGIYGNRVVGGLRVAVRAALRGRYDVDVTDARTGALVLRTSFYRRDTDALGR